MKYYVIEITTGDAKVEGKAIYEYETRKDAIASFHQKLSTAMGSDLYTSDLVMVINSTGGIEMFEKYVDEVIE